MNDAKEEIRARLPVEEVVGQYVELRRAGKNLKGRSPWGVDRTPSFMVSPEKGIWHDFSANKGGDIFTFVMEVEGISFREALEKLAQQAGVELKKYAGGNQKVAERKRQMRACLELACKFYQVCLTKNPEVCEYVFYKRNMNRKTAQDFRIGYAPRGGKVLINFLMKKGFSKAEIEEAGLMNRFGGDLFQGRMMVPFMDVVGNVIGFTARILDKGEPKYLNTPETLLFNKSGFIFGLTQAKEAIRRSGFAVIVEGNMDVISSHQAGVCEAVATSGTAMTELHLRTLGRLVGDVRLAYDADDAGVKAAERAIMMAGGLGVRLAVVSDFEGAKDPDELIQRGAEKWQAAVGKAVPAMEWLLDKYEERVDLSTGVGKREYSDVAMKLIRYIQDPVERKHYEQLVAKKLAVEVADLEAKRTTEGRKILRPVKEQKEESAAIKNLRRLRKEVAAILVFGGVEVPEIEAEIPEDTTELAELELIFEERYREFDAERLMETVRELTEREKQEERKVRAEELREQLTEAEGDEEVEKILRELEKLQKGAVGEVKFY